MLEYYIAEQDLYIFQLTRNGIGVHLVPGAVSKLERLLSLWRVNLDLTAQASGASDRAQAFAGLQENSLGLLQRLYDLLLKPVAGVLKNVEHLIVVPYGMLHYLPFHCLFDGVQYLRLETGVITPGMLADFVAVDLNSPVLAGWNEDDLNSQPFSW